MRKTLLRAFVIGCSLLVTCELAHAGSFKLAADDPIPICNTSPQPASVTCMAFNNSSGDVFNLTTPEMIASTLWETHPSGRPELTFDISSEQSILVSGGSGPVTADPSTAPLNSVSFTMTNGATFGGFRFSIVGAAVVPTDLTVTVLPAQNVSGTMGVLLPALTFTPQSVGPNGQKDFALQANTGFSIASITISGSDFTGLNVLRLVGPLTDEGFTTPVQPPGPEIETPEPDTLSLLGFGLTGFGLCFRKLRRRCN